MEMGTHRGVRGVVHAPAAVLSIACWLPTAIVTNLLSTKLICTISIILICHCQVKSKAHNPGDDLISELVVNQVR